MLGIAWNTDELASTVIELMGNTFNKKKREHSQKERERENDMKSHNKFI